MRGMQNGRPVPVFNPDPFYFDELRAVLATNPELLQAPGERTRPAELGARTSPAPSTDALEIQVGRLPEHSVWLTDYARCKLDDLLQRTRWEDGREFGGFCYGRHYADGIQVNDVVLVEDAPRTRYSVTLDIDWVPRYMDGLGVVGDWHFHPKGAGLPSKADARAWDILRRELHAPLFAGLVCVEARDGFGYDARAWVARSDAGRAFCSPASVERAETEAV